MRPVTKGRPGLLAVGMSALCLGGCGLFGGSKPACACNAIDVNSTCLEISGSPLSSAQLELACNTSVLAMCELGGEYLNDGCPEENRVAECSQTEVQTTTARYFFSIGPEPFDASSDFESECSDLGEPLVY